MTEREHFEVVLSELRGLLHDLADLAESVVLVGGQVLALEDLAQGGEGVVRVTTPHGIILDRGFSLESDLLIDFDRAGPRSEFLLDVLRARGFERIRNFRWKRMVSGYPVELDLFHHPEANREFIPTPSTPLPGAELAMSRPRIASVNLEGGRLEIAVPDALGYLATKVQACAFRPGVSKDPFDAYAFLMSKGAATIARALGTEPDEWEETMAELDRLFGKLDAPGVRGVLRYAIHLADVEGELLAQSIVDLMDEIHRRAGVCLGAHGLVFSLWDCHPASISRRMCA